MTAPRRTFAIISHPDAGKTTLTEKLLMYSGAISEAGAVKARAGKQRDVTSDWMEMERERGISITSTVLQFNYDGHVFNLLDTPGHRDFSEDTYRVLSAVDAAIIVLDAAKGIEAQTKKLFEVAKRKKTPIITLINKCDRPGLAPLELLDDIEDQLGIVATPLTWPVGMGPDFVGVVDRRDNAFWKFGRTDHGATAAAEERLEGADLASHGDVGITAAGELDLLDGVGADHDLELFLAGETTPVFFGSAVWNFGIRLLLDAIADLAPAPSPRLTIHGERHPIDREFSGFVFKIQANLDPRHRDRIAYLRVNSGQFERGIQLTNHRTQRSFAANFAHQLFGRDRETVATAYPGDIIGLISSGNLQIGDTLSESGKLQFPPIPTFAPELFMKALNLDTSRYKQFRRGMAELDEEGAIQVLHHPLWGEQQPILAAVGQLQYDVAVARLEGEYGAKLELSATPFTEARRTDAAGAEALAGERDCEVVERRDGTLLALFKGKYRMEATRDRHPDIMLDSILVS
ncbi:MAG: peptide chain release factor 3 [Acidimicrobiia bacterium]|nr:peptide chain release factor 3 [Acidimicrobiia bacterium]MDH5504867.1 peptide chain release factor 3 [Acidimicrobiia bacterium]